MAEKDNASDRSTLSEASGPAPAGGGRARSDWYALYKRLVRSRRVRVFFLLALLVHVALAVAVSQRTIYEALAIGEREEFEAPPWELQRALDDLARIYRNYFTQSYDELVEIRGRLEEIRSQALTAMQKGDRRRKEMIERGQWPSPEKPNRSIRYKPRVDVDPNAVTVTEAAPAAKLSLYDLYKAHQVIEVEARRLFERYHALRLAEDEFAILPLSEAIEKTHFSDPPRQDIRFHEQLKHVRSSLGQEFRDYKRMLVNAYLETQDILETARLMRDEAEGKYALPATSVLFGDAVDIVPAPVPYEGDYLNPLLLEQRDLKQMIYPEVVFGVRIGRNESSCHVVKYADGQPKRTRIDWMCVDRWYYVGPFQHPGHERRMMQLEHKFPPEQHVDLGQVFTGKTDRGTGKPRKIRWKYRRFGPTIPDVNCGQAHKVHVDLSHDLCCIRPYVTDNERLGVWYFYTRIMSDRDQTVLGSFASDDYGVCWINGKRVFQAPPITRPWVPFTLQDFRKVPLREGVNEVLYKLENSKGRTGFSMFLMTHTNEALIRALDEMRRQAGRNWSSPPAAADKAGDRLHGTGPTRQQRE